MFSQKQLSAGLQKKTDLLFLFKIELKKTNASMMPNLKYWPTDRTDSPLNCGNIYKLK